MKDELWEILRLRFTEEEAQIGARMPMTPAPLETLSKRMGQSAAALETKLERMAEKGLVLDFENEGKWFYMLAPTVMAIRKPLGSTPTSPAAATAIGNMIATAAVWWRVSESITVTM